MDTQGNISRFRSPEDAERLGFVHPLTEEQAVYLAEQPKSERVQMLHAMNRKERRKQRKLDRQNRKAGR